MRGSAEVATAETYLEWLLDSRLRAALAAVRGAPCVASVL